MAAIHAAASYAVIMGVRVALGCCGTAQCSLSTHPVPFRFCPGVVVLQEEKALKALKEKAKTGSVGGAGLKKSGKK